MLVTRLEELSPAHGVFEPPRLSRTAQRIKNPGPRRAAANFGDAPARVRSNNFTIRAFPPDGKLSDNPEGQPSSPCGSPGGEYRESGQTPRPGAGPVSGHGLPDALLAADAWSPARRRASRRRQPRAARSRRPGPASTRSVGGIASSDASLVKTANSERRRRSSPRSLNPVKNPLLPARPAHAGLPVPCADGTAGPRNRDSSLPGPR
jgi:hypothetical protein